MVKYLEILYVLIMLNIHKEIKMLAYDHGISITKILNTLRARGVRVPMQNNFAAKCRQGNIRFDEVQQILDYLGYKLVIEEK